MTDAMTLCTACLRHVFAREPRCPFCAHALEPGRALAADPGPAASRAQRYALGVALAAAAACDHPRPQPPAIELVTTRPDVAIAAASPDVAAPPTLDAAVADAAVADTTVADAATTHHAHHSTGHVNANPFGGDGDPRLHWHRHFNNMPYGCVFPDAWCDVVSA